MRGSQHWELVLKLVLAIATLVLLVSQVGFLFVPLLLPLHAWAGRRSGKPGRVAWSFLPSAGIAATAWAAVYVTVGEAKPAIWLVPALVFASVWVLVFTWTGRPRTLGAG